MLCRQCGYYAEEEAVVCPQCGALLRADEQSQGGGAEMIRQGRRAREAVKNRPAQIQEEIRRRRRSGASRATVPVPTVRDNRNDIPDFDDPILTRESGIGEERETEDDGVQRLSRPVYSDETIRQAQAAAYAATHAPGRKPGKMVNWYLRGVVLGLLIVFVLGGGYFFLKKTEPGQRLMARLGQEATSTALWAVGEEKLDYGDIASAIESFERAKAQDAEKKIKKCRIIM